MSLDFCHEKGPKEATTALHHSTPPQLCWGQKIFARDITYVARDENMAVKMSDATHERFYDVGKWQRILLIVIIMSKYV